MVYVKAENVSKRHSDRFAVENIDLELKQGEILGVLGPNGAGKSTLMELMTGQIERDSGSLKILGLDPKEKSVEIRDKVGILPEREDPPSFLTGEEYLDFISDIRDEHVDSYWAERLGIKGKLDSMTKDLSKGERQKFMVLQAFFHNPELVFIDEPLTNLDPLVQEEVKSIFREHREEGGSMVLSTHVVSLAEEICDRVVFLKDGEIVEEIDKVEDLKNKFVEAEG